MKRVWHQELDDCLLEAKRKGFREEHIGALMMAQENMLS